MDIWYKENNAPFFRTKDEWGIFSNFASSPLVVDGLNVKTTEALYQAYRFSGKGDIQRQIIEAKSPMTAKMISRKYINETRPDWNLIKVQAMYACLIPKYIQCQKFREELERSRVENRQIFEISRKDNYWGAIPVDPSWEVFEGNNVLGLQLMYLRERKGIPLTSLLKNKYGFTLYKANNLD